MKLKQAVQALAALAQESRLNVFRLLVEAGTEGLSAGEISEQLDIPPATLSFHLKELAATGLIDSVRDGRSLIYSLRPKAMHGLLQFLMQDCCQGRPELCQPDFEGGNACCQTPRSKSAKKAAR
jgi:ArsR family transcriptional regulator, arsenate/arsenite/antimonite-responsive transcriptional repressor